MPSPRDTLPLFLLLALCAYGVAGMVIFRRWLRRRQSRRPSSTHADPGAWVSYWLPLLIAVEVIALGGGVIVFIMMLVALPADQAPYTLIGAGGGLIVIALCMAGFDIAWVARVRTLGRRNPTDQTL